MTTEEDLDEDLNGDLEEDLDGDLDGDLDEDLDEDLDTVSAIKSADTSPGPESDVEGLMVSVCGIGLILRCSIVELLMQCKRWDRERGSRERMEDGWEVAKIVYILDETTRLLLKERLRVSPGETCGKGKR